MQISFVAGNRTQGGYCIVPFDLARPTMMQQEEVDSYDVLLSFRGPDVRQGFLSVLYDQLDRAGVRVFRDDDELIPGTRINTILEAIARSKICVPIFSRNFASSKWCLREVARMVELEKEIIPIFYDVRRADVRLQTDLYNYAIEQQQHAVKQEQWKDALQTVAEFVGMELGATNYIEFCERFVRMVLDKLKAQEAVDSYDVYPSFRSVDVGQGFLSVLCSYLNRAGIRVYRYQDDLSPGTRVDTLLKSLANAKICVPIFSRNFASSKWCLREVAAMVEQEKEIIPIFYDVTPDDVKLETQLYVDAIMRHHDADSGLVREGKNALKTVGKIKGVELLETSYVEFCNSFVKNFFVKLKPTKRYNIKGLVRMNDQVDSTMELLKIDSLDIRYVGIHGMGGIGKSTLARFVFNQLSSSFQCCAFIEDIRDSSGRHGLEYLEQQLREKLDPKYIINSNLSRDIKERFHTRKVLIVLDDVDKVEQIEKLAGEPSWFGLGSRIIITTRNTDVLTGYRKLDRGSIFTQEMKTLENDDALELFYKYAFGKHPPAPAFENLSREVVSTAGGLPLAITVLGSLLRNKDEPEVWKDIIAKSREVPAKEVIDRLKISYDALDDDQKQVFLDIACFFIGTEMSDASYLWGARKLYPSLMLAALTSMSLVKFTDKKEFWMHDHLRDLGRKIARDQSSLPRNRARIWVHEEALKVLRSRENKEKVEYIRLEEPCIGYNWTLEHFSSLENLRYLQLKGANIQVDVADLLPNLIWLSWHSFPSDFEDIRLPLINLVILDLSRSLISENWVGWRKIQMAEQLKVLNLTSCHNLSVTPEFPEDMKLERLILKACRNLVVLHSSISNLKELQHLNLQECCSLRELPEGLHLEKLKEILIEDSGLNLSML